MAEPGFWAMTDKEAESFRAYLKRAGFVIFDDFRERRHWDNLQEQMRRVLPEARWIELDGDRSRSATRSSRSITRETLAPLRPTTSLLADATGASSRTTIRPSG